MANFSPELSYYLRHSDNTDPEEYGYLFKGFDVENISAIFQAARNVVEHHAGMNAEIISSSQLVEIDIYRVRDMLKKIADHGVKNLNSPISLENKIIGNCLNISKIACAILRDNGIPSRLRYAYCTYFYTDFNHEQTLVEYWDARRKKWLRGDASMNLPILNQRNIKVDIDLLNVKKSLSMPVAEVWQACRRGDDDFERYGASIDLRKRAGMGNVALKLIQDLACLNHIELMPWDLIGPAKNFLTSKRIKVSSFDLLAEMLLNGAWENLIYSNNKIPFCAKPRRILRRSPYTGFSVTLLENGKWKRK